MTEKTIIVRVLLGLRRRERTRLRIGISDKIIASDGTSNDVAPFSEICTNIFEGSETTFATCTQRSRLKVNSKLDPVAKPGRARG